MVEAAIKRVEEIMKGLEEIKKTLEELKSKSPERRLVKVSDSSEWKDRAAGWHRWKLCIPQCRECGRTNTHYFLNGTQADAQRLLNDPQNDYCDKCS